jgi:AAA domain
LLYGPRGEGKTYLVLAVIVALISGGKFLDWEAPKPRKVLLIDGEMPGAALQERLRSLLKMVASEVLERLRVITPDEQVAFALSLNRAEDQAEIAAAIEWADVIVLDNLACLTSGDENDREAWLPVQGWILRLRAQGKTVLLIHHSGKGGDQRGTSSKEDVLDTVIKLKRPYDYEDQQGLRVEWHFVKHRSFYGDDAAPLEIQLEDASPGAGKRWKHHKLEDALLKLAVELFKEPKATERSVAQIMDIPPSRVHRLKKKAKSMGLL